MMESTPDTQANKAPSAATDALPEWLQQLAVESWQVELLISGFAIVGTAQLTDLLEPLASYVLFTYRLEVIDYIGFAFIYLRLGFVLLPILFAIHFSVRAFWVGLVGLASVYPKGIGPERSAAAPEVYVEYIKERYPPIAVWIARTESVASLVFVVAAVIAMTFVGTAISVATLVLAAYLVELVSMGVIPFGITVIVLLSIVGVLFLLSTAMQSEKIREKPWAKRIYLRSQIWTSVALFPVFTHPVMYLTTVLVTNLKPQPPLRTLSLILGTVMLGFFLHSNGPNADALGDTDELMEASVRTQQYLPSRYQDAWPADDYLPLRPYVEQQRVAATALLEVSVPTLGEDRYRIEQLTPEASSVEEDTVRSVRRSMRRARQLAATKAYYRFRVDTLVLPVEDFVRYSGAGRSRGVRALVRLPPKLPAGRQVLWVDRRTREGKLFEEAAALPLIVE